MSDTILDLTLPFRRDMRGFDWEHRFTLERDGWNARTLHLYSHAGTHMDAQVHFVAGPETLDQIALERCCGRPRVAHLPETRPREWLTPAHLGPLEQSFQPGEILLLATGWSRYREQPEVYRDGLPRVGDELARWCVDRSVKLLGVETPSVCDVNSLEELTRIHRILLLGGVVIVEGLTGLEQVRDGVGWFVAAPLKIEGGDGCPCRAFVVNPERGGAAASL
ncbi:MAG: cyclase family protein [Armatimonadetes bacterium]|nr:cyclase family protein [Armatimonadota bacterium]